MLQKSFWSIQGLPYCLASRVLTHPPFMIGLLHGRIAPA